MRRRFLRKARREARAYPSWICKRRATKPLRKKIEQTRPSRLNGYGLGELDSFLALVQINRASLHSLHVLDEVADALGIGFLMAMAFERISPASGFDEDVGPNQSSFDVDGGDFGYADADFVLVEPRALAADDGEFCDFDDGGEEKISLGATAGCKRFRRHNRTMAQELRLSNLILAAGVRTSSVSSIVLLDVDKLLGAYRRLDSDGQNFGLDVVDRALVLQNGLFGMFWFRRQSRFLFSHSRQHRSKRLRGNRSANLMPLSGKIFLGKNQTNSYELKGVQAICKIQLHFSCHIFGHTAIRPQLKTVNAEGAFLPFLMRASGLNPRGKP